jgi:histidinol-phosphate aminotransferase
MTLPKPIKFKVERYIGGLSRFKKIDNPIKLSANESALGPSPKAIQAIEKDKDKIFKYPESDSNSLREVLSKKFNIDSKRIICGSGSDQIFDLTCHLFLEPGDEVVVTEFGFIMHRIYASLYKAKVILAKEKNFKASVDEILGEVTDKTKIVFIANPNNPTGTYLSKNEMLNLRKKLRSDILLVVDDAYFEFLDSDDFTSGLDLFKDSTNVLITRTFSKIYGLAGLRLGWGYSSKEIIDAMYQIKPPFNVNRIALAAGIEAIKDNEWTKRAIEHNTLWSKKIFSVLKEFNIKTNEPTANFFLMNFEETKINSDEAFEKLAAEKLILRKMTQYKIPNALRLTIGNKEVNEHFIKSVGSILK